MRIAIHTLGTRGDVQPYVALALGLKATGHEVLLAAPAQFESFVIERGIAFAALPGEFLDLMETPEAKAAMGGGKGFGAGFKLIKQFKPIGRRLLSAEWNAARQFRPDLFVYHPKAVGAPHIAEKLAVPAMLASPLPGFTPTSEFASPLLPFRSVGPFNRLSHRLMAESGDFLFRAMIGEWREREIGLPRRPARRLSPVATLYAYSAHVQPRPHDWGEDVAVTGYWFLDDDRPLAPELDAFLGAGAPPIYFGFGSMPGFYPEQVTDVVVGALTATGKRGVIATGGGALARREDTERTMFVEQASHRLLMPRVAGAVHHGGAGTTAAALRAGVPMAIMPFFGDQPFWARRVAELGAGPPPLERKTLSAESLAAALRTLDDRATQSRAAELGAAIRTEDGVAAAVRFIEERTGTSRS